MDGILKKYGRLLERVDDCFARSAELHPAQIACRAGCSGCCRGLFDITLLDAAWLRSGFELLPGAVREQALRKAEERTAWMKLRWPELAPPYILNLRPEEEWDELMPDDDETPCPLLAEDGTCLVYRHRPMTCRLHGIPLFDISGEAVHDSWCTLNFAGLPVESPERFRAPFFSMFDEELALFHELTQHLFGRRVSEADMLIPSALLVDIRGFAWKQWGDTALERFIQNPLQ